MELSGILNGLPVGPVPIRGRAAGAVLVRNPRFTLTFTHPEIVNAGEPYTLDVTVTNTGESPRELRVGEPARPQHQRRHARRRAVAGSRVHRTG